MLSYRCLALLAGTGSWDVHRFVKLVVKKQDASNNMILVTPLVTNIALENHHV